MGLASSDLGEAEAHRGRQAASIVGALDSNASAATADAWGDDPAHGSRCCAVLPPRGQRQQPLLREHAWHETVE